LRSDEKLVPVNTLLESVTQSPELFPFAFDVRSDHVTLIRLTRADYENASFLDARILTPKTPSRATSWGLVAKSIEAAQLTEHCRFIFHIGHVGSTLLSRLLGAHPQVFALREPLVLRTFATPQSMASGGDFADRLTGILKLLSRTFDANQVSIVKATSFVSELAAALMSRASALPALALYVSAESYMATILGGPNSRQEAKILAPSRIDRLHRRLGHEEWRGTSLSEGEVLALTWACEMSALAEAIGIARERILQIDFDQFLQDPSVLFAVFRHFGVAVSDGEVRTILAGPDMRRYSKAPQFAYDPALRLAVLNEARATHAAEIHRGLAWLDRAASKWPVVGRAMTLGHTSASRAASLGVTQKPKP
jgi:hypothetical protein